MGRLDIPKIEWDSGPNTLEFGYPLDGVVTWPEPDGRHELVVAPSGTRDAWKGRHEPRLSGQVRWVPTTDGTTPAGDPITGWDGSTGWSAFLEFARNGNTFEFFPDRTTATSITSVLVEPLRGEPSTEDDGTRTFQLVIGSTGGTKYTGY